MKVECVRTLAQRRRGQTEAQEVENSKCPVCRHYCEAKQMQAKPIFLIHVEATINTAVDVRAERG